MIHGMGIHQTHLPQVFLYIASLQHGTKSIDTLHIQSHLQPLLKSLIFSGPKLSGSNSSIGLITYSPSPSIKNTGIDKGQNSRILPQDPSSNFLLPPKNSLAWGWHSQLTTHPTRTRYPQPPAYQPPLPSEDRREEETHQQASHP